MVKSGEIPAMQGNDVYWKDNIADLRGRAAAVMNAPVEGILMSPRTAAACLSGIVGLVARRWTVDTMQRTCAEIARSDVAWSSMLGRLPHVNGIVSEPMQLVAVVARSILPLAGEKHLRAALAFWASEDDPAVWNSVAA